MGNNYFGKTDIGLRRATNQDYFVIKNLDDGLVLMIVCDGMGGANGGSEASMLAALTFAEYTEKHLDVNNKNEYLYVLECALELANKTVCDKAGSSKELEGMGTTLVGVLYDGESYYCIWVGDSRIYAMTESGLCQISHDHSFVQTLVDSGSISKEEAKSHPNRNIITKAVGIEEAVVPDVCKLSSERIEGMMLCTDGLCGYVNESEIEQVLKAEMSAEKCCKELVKAANDAGGPDNITVVVHKIQ